MSLCYPMVVPRTTAETGWTTFTATEPSGEGSAFVGAGTRKIYVAAAGSGGSDSNTGTQASPKLTIAGGKALLRAGKPDWLLFNKGDTWTNQAFGGFTTSGVSATEPVLISSYGTGARPLFKTSAAQNLFDTGTGGDYVAIVGLEGHSYQRNPSDGGYAGVPTDASIAFIRYVLDGTNYMLIEDCKMSFYGHGMIIQLQGTGNVLKIRRNVIVDSYSPTATGHSSGAYIEMPDANGLLLEENYFDHNGWNGTVANTNTDDFNHAIYVQNSADFLGGACVMRRNVSTNNSYAGLYPRPGGTIDNNLCVSNAVGIDVGFDTALNTPTATVTNNVVLQSRDTSTTTLGWGIHFRECNNCSITGNIISQAGGVGGNQFGISLEFSNNNTATGNVIFDVETGFADSGSGNTTTPNQIDLNGDNVEFSFPAPTRDVGTYAGTIGLTATLAAFVTAFRAQSRDNWRTDLMADAVNDYIRAGFGL